MKRIHTLTLFLFLSSLLPAQINYTAQDFVPPYEDQFLYGSNMGFYEPWSDEQLADIAIGNPAQNIPGVGVTSLRPALPHWFLEKFGYEVEVDDFEYYTSLGAKNNTVFVGYPDDPVRDWTEYCNGEPSLIFKDIYQPIWDGGANGTPVNENNPYALYLWRTVNIYKDHVKFWEIWNEPDLDHGGNGWRPQGDPLSWWDRNPPPCDFKLKAPIFSYVRLLRISYEVIKSIDPEAYIAVGGLGYTSFLDALMRNTDNPNEGTATGEYPLKGGAYFDCLSYHSYPHIDGSLRDWNHPRGDWDLYRHSDAAVEGVFRLQDEFNAVLHHYGYDGNTYPEKVTILTETNIPRKQMENYIGSDEAQRNFLIKTAVMCQKRDIQQLCVYDMGEKKKHWEAYNSFNMMGFYESLHDDAPGQEIVTDGGIAYKSVSDLLKGYKFDENQTALIAIPEGAEGAAFKNSLGKFMYVLWAKTSEDNTEQAEAVFNFPDDLSHVEYKKYNWDYGRTGEHTTIEPNGILLSGSPIFLKPTAPTLLPVDLVRFTANRVERDVVLEWVTETERDNKEFVIEHSVEGRDFSAIGVIAGAGTTVEAQFYTFTHDRAVRGNNYYRLKQVDTDGSYTYSETAVVNIESSFLFTITPTHADDFINIEFYDFYDKDIEMIVCDVLGRIRMEETLVAGRNAKMLDVQHLDAGHYFIRMKVRGEDYFTKRFVKVKL